MSRMQMSTLLCVFFTLIISTYGDDVQYYEWHVTLASRSPSCYERPVVLVNQEFRPALKVTQGDTIAVNVFNDLPKNYSELVGGGISIHWHGFDMLGAEWYDGVSYVTQCPIPSGANFTYTFKVDEAPGTYLWHDHSVSAKADGLQGPLIVNPSTSTTEAFTYDSEYTLFLSDWYHTPAPEQAIQLNRPFDLAKTSTDSGAWKWIGLPNSVLLNGNGFSADCTNTTNGNITTSTCTPIADTSPAAVNSTGGRCLREELVVDPKKVYRVRLINAASLVYLTVCFEGHSITLVAADAVPVEPVEYPGGCIDINAGQKRDILLTTDQPAGSYWITALPQYRPGSPNGYGVLRYRSAPAGLPTTPTVQPGAVLPAAGNATIAKIKPLAAVMGANATKYGFKAPLKVPQAANLTIGINSTQPVLQATGQLRWALNNIAQLRSPPCSPLMASSQSDPQYFTKHAVPAPDNYTVASLLNGPAAATTPYRPLEGRYVTIEKPYGVAPMPTTPLPGMHIVQVKLGEVVDVILQNNAAQAYGGEYRAEVNRTVQEQHPFHLHGQRFWVLAQGSGRYDPSNISATPNLLDPPYLDTATLPPDAWLHLRFQANNPGLWPFHCHIWAHLYMGQMLYFSVGAPSAPPTTLPMCPTTCAGSFTALKNSTSAANLTSAPTSAKKKSSATAGHGGPVGFVQMLMVLALLLCSAVL